MKRLFLWHVLVADAGFYARNGIYCRRHSFGSCRIVDWGLCRYGIDAVVGRLVFT